MLKAEADWGIMEAEAELVFPHPQRSSEGTHERCAMAAIVHGHACENASSQLKLLGVKQVKRADVKCATCLNLLNVRSGTATGQVAMATR